MICVVVALWKRMQLSKLVVRRIRKLLPDERIVIVGSDDDARAVAESVDAVFIQHANSPLSFKWNAGFEAAYGYDVLRVDSDTVFSSDAVRSLLQIDATHGGFSDIYFHHLVSGRTKHWAYDFKACVGTVQLFRKELLEACAWRMWDEPHERSLDLHSRKKLMRLGASSKFLWMDDTRWLVDIKTSTNIWSYDQIPQGEVCELPAEADEVVQGIKGHVLG